MTLALKQSLDGTILPDDHDVIHDGETLARIYCVRSSEQWRWTLKVRSAAWPTASTRPRRRSGVAWEAAN